MKNSAGRGVCYNILRDLRTLHILRKPNSIIALLFIQNILKLSKEKMSFTFNNFAPAYPFISPRRKTFVKLPLNPLQL